MTSFFENLKAKNLASQQNNNQIQNIESEVEEIESSPKQNFFENIAKQNIQGIPASAPSTSIPPEDKDPGLVDEMTRYGAQYGTRILELLGGFTDLADLGKNILTGESELIPLPEELKKYKGQTPDWLNKIVRGTPGLGSVPSGGGSQQIKQVLSEGTNGFTDPQGPWEKSIGEGLQTFASLFLPGNRGPQGQAFRTFNRKLGTAVGAQTAKEGVKILGGSENAQEAAKMGSLFTLSLALPTLFGQQSADMFRRDLYRRRDALVPQGARTSAGALQQKISTLREEMRGVQTPITREINTVLNELEGLIENGTIPVHRLTESTTRINDLRKNLYRQGVTDVENERRLFGRVMNGINETLDAYGASSNPEFLQMHRTANEVHGAMQQSNRFSNFVRKYVPFMKTKTPLVLLFEGGMPSAGTAAKMGLAGAAGAGALSLVRLQNRIMRSPALRGYYNQIVINGLREDAPAMMRYIEKLDKELQKEEKSRNDLYGNSKKDQQSGMSRRPQLQPNR